MICQMWDIRKPLSLGITHTENHLVFSWNNNVFFSSTRRGATMDIHIAATKKGRRDIRVAVSMYLQYLTSTYSWLKNVIAFIPYGKQSVINLAENCGFRRVGKANDCEVYLWVV